MSKLPQLALSWAVKRENRSLSGRVPQTAQGLVFEEVTSWLVDLLFFCFYPFFAGDLDGFEPSLARRSRNLVQSHKFDTMWETESW